MCFSFPVSLTLGFLGICLAKYSSLNKRYGYRDIALFYSFMELLQAVQYLLVEPYDSVQPYDSDKRACSLPNYFSTLVAHVLVVVQPAMWNLFRYRSQRENKDIFYFAFLMSLIWAVFFSLRLFYLPLGPVVPFLQEKDILTGSEICSWLGPTHVYWTLPYYSYSGLEANLFTYLLLWFFPTVYEKQGIFKLSLWLVQIAIILSVVSLVDELPTFWCALSVPFLFMSVFSKEPSPSLISRG
ncbi:putative transmembrane protein [Cedratvirus kamchatka]|uniref:Transmembrane protein n=1 Tax=Cedratvirus kamchatka TaxID=2716914 RepID=A0A6G8MZN2_9VIRU|nr:putative transmembrane protein [Cedratvirus kamchatka]WIL04374.1 putative membrane protein [Cedratvirus lena]WIL04964.1 putative membrane protein [Cedratvirus duvanny]